MARGAVRRSSVHGETDEHLKKWTMPGTCGAICLAFQVLGMASRGDTQVLRGASRGAFQVLGMVSRGDTQVLGVASTGVSFTHTIVPRLALIHQLDFRVPVCGRICDS